MWPSMSQDSRAVNREGGAQTLGQRESEGSEVRVRSLFGDPKRAMRGRLGGARASARCRRRYGRLVVFVRHVWRLLGRRRSRQETATMCLPAKRLHGVDPLYSTATGQLGDQSTLRR